MAAPLDSGGLASSMAQTTQRSMRSIYASLLWWLTTRGELDPEAGPADRLTIKRLPHYLAARGAAVTPNTLYNNLRMLALMLNCLAPGHDWNAICRHPLAPRKADAAASRRTVRLIDPGRIYGGLMDRLASVADVPPSADLAIRMRDLLLVAVCQCTTLRLKNLLDLTIDANIFRYPGGVQIRLPAGMTKTSRQIVTRLPSDLTPFLDRYLAECRPLLMETASGSAGAELWLTRKGARLSRASAQLIFKRITREIQEWSAGPHSFRHSAVTTLVAPDPRKMNLAAALLGHGGTETTEGTYDLSSDDVAWARWHSLVSRYLPPNHDRRRGKRR